MGNKWILYTGHQHTPLKNAVLIQLTKIEHFSSKNVLISEKLKSIRPRYSYSHEYLTHEGSNRSRTSVAGQEIVEHLGLKQQRI